MEQTQLGQGTSHTRVTNLNFSKNERQIIRKLAVADMDEDSVRSELRKAPEVAAANDCVIELLMKDNNTPCHNPINVTNWCRIAREKIYKL
jgi:hypothetical protein